MAPKRQYDEKRVEAAVRDMLAAMGEDPERRGLKDTPRRVAAMYRELLAGTDVRPSQVLKTLDGDKHDEIVLVRDIPLAVPCALLARSSRASSSVSPGGCSCRSG